MSELFENLDPPKKNWLKSESPTQPVFWISEIRFLANLSTDQDAQIRKITLRKGLNIIWSEGSKYKGPEEQRGRGHGAGKTSLCRAIRYLLGEKHYGNKFIRERMAANKELSRSYIIGDVWVGDTKWTVARALYQGGRHFAVVGSSIEDTIQSSRADRLPFKEFTKELGKAVISRLKVRTFDSSKTHPISWRHVIQALARDQETHLSSLQNWRDTSSASDSPEMSDPDRSFLVRCLIGIADPEEGNQLKTRSDSQSQIAKDKTTIETYRRVFSDTLKSIQDEFRDIQIPTTSEDPLFINRVSEHVLEKQNDSIKALEDKIKNLGIESLEKSLQLLGEEKARIEGRLEEPKRELERLQKHLQAHRLKREPTAGDDEKLREQILQNVKRKTKHCCVPIEDAMSNCELYWRLGIQDAVKKDPVSDYSETIVQQLENQIKEAENELAPQQNQIKELDTKISAKNTKLASAKRTAKKHQIDLDNIRSNPGPEVRHSENVIDALRKIEEAKTSTSDQDDIITKADKRLNEIREGSKIKQKKTSDIFNTVIQNIAGKSYTGKLSFSRIENTAALYREGELQSEAFKALKALAYDLTILISSFHKLGFHPGWLLHDSPRESDLEPTLYKYFLMFSHQLEDYFSNSFQHIVTTTEDPPDELKDPQYVREKLDSSEKSGFLYRVVL